MKLKVAEAAREKKRKADQESKDALKRIKEDAQKAAEHVKRRKQEQENHGSSVFTATLPADLVPLATEMSDLCKLGEHWKAPWVMKGGDSLNSCFGDAPLHKALTS